MFIIHKIHLDYTRPSPPLLSPSLSYQSPSSQLLRLLLSCDLMSCIGVIYRAVGPVSVVTPLKKTSPSLYPVITGYKSAGRHETP